MIRVNLPQRMYEHIHQDWPLAGCRSQAVEAACVRDWTHSEGLSPTRDNYTYTVKPAKKATSDDRPPLL